MPAVATRADAIRLELSGTEIQHIVAVGTIPGIKILAVAGRNGTGRGHLRAIGANSRYVSWKAPGSTYWGPAVYVGSDGSYLLEAEDDVGKWLRVQAYTSFMLSSPTFGRVHLRDVFNNAVAKDDVTASEASAGDVLAYTITVANDAAYDVENVKVWLDSSASGFAELEIGDDGATWFQPTSETHVDVIQLGTIAAGGTDTLHCRRTIAAAASSDADVLNHLILSWETIE